MPQPGHSVRPPRRRDKPILSCITCRQRKLRCDRQSPCGACERRGTPSECVFSCSEQERKDAIDYRPHARSKRTRRRIERLEGLVTEMRDMLQSPRRPSDSAASQSGTFQNPLTLSDDQGTDSLGKLSLTDSHAQYIGNAHWATILEDIQNIKDELAYDDSETAPGQEGQESQESQESTTFDPTSSPKAETGRVSLLSSEARLSKDEILAVMPSRKVVDRHVSQFFNNFDFSTVILYRKKFLAEYESFWANPSAAPVMWIGLLYGIMGMSSFLQLQLGFGVPGASASEMRDMLNTYRAYTVHCLIAGDYLRSTKYTIETLIFYFATEQNMSLDADIANWVLIGVVIRVAFRMGFHRDPSHWPHIRPFQAELRRRIWMVLYQMDFYTSAQVGLPRIIKDSQCDTRPPANILDEDIDLELDELPPERPLTVLSGLSHVISRHAIIKLIAEIYDATEAAVLLPSTINRLRTKLDNTIKTIPAELKYKPLEASVSDSPMTILHRMFIDTLIHKATYLLHRRSFVKGANSHENAESNELCIKAALAILQHQRRMNEETQPGGLMFNIRWKVFSSFNHEFLQATIMLCFALSKLDRSRYHVSSGVLRKRDDIVEALTAAHGMWEGISDRSTEAQRAVKAITAVLRIDADRTSASNFTSSHAISFERTPVMDTQGLFGNFDYGPSMAFDPALFTIDDDMTIFGDGLDGFMG